MFILLCRRKILSLKNKILHFSRWEIIKNIVFISVGTALLSLLYYGFWRLLNYLENVEVIGPVLSWKLTGMVLLITFAMIVVSSIIISMTTLYYSSDLKFLFSCPIKMRFLFMDKSMDTIFYSSWTLMLAILPYIIALARVKNFGILFYISYFAAIIPFIMIAAAFGILFSMVIMYLFPSSRTRDITWIIGSLSVGFVYVLFRFSRPERLIRPNALEVVAQYINYLQSPTAEYLPSWWLTKGMMSFASGHWGDFALYFFYLLSVSIMVYVFIIWLSEKFYQKGFSGAQSGVKFRGNRSDFFEQKLSTKIGFLKEIFIVVWKDRLLFLRDARYWTQIVLIVSLILVYLFSIKQLPLDSQNIKSLVSFLNVGVAGFVIAAINLRFVFPAVSLEGKSYWILRSSPVKTETLMAAKLIVSGVPAMLVAVILVFFSNKLLEADFFISFLTFATIIISSIVVSVMAIGIGAIFPDFSMENIHQIESSYGGFLYMACAMGYFALVVGLESWPVQMHFAQIYGRPNAWDFEIVSFCLIFFIILNLTAVLIPWKMGVRNLKKHEI
mgnify:CR=1 FL=1